MPPSTPPCSPRRSGAAYASRPRPYLQARHRLRSLPFRQAHEIVGQAIREAEREGKQIQELPLETLKKFSPAFGADLGSALTVEAALARRRVPGGTAPESVRGALVEIRARLGKREVAR